MKAFRFVLVLAIALAFLGLAPHVAKAGQFSYSSSINLQNLEDAIAQITITYYKQDGTIDTTVTQNIPPLAPFIYNPIGASDGFNGSVVISSDRQIASISNIEGDNYKAAASYVAQSAGNTTVNIPLLMKGNSGYNTWFNVQNTGTADATVTVAYSDGTVPPTNPTTIKPGAAKTFDQALEVSHPKIFGALVTSTGGQPIVATVIIENPTIMSAYNGFTTAGSTNPVMPLVNENNAGYKTGITIQNTGGLASIVTVSYKNSGAGTDCVETQTIAANSVATYALVVFTGTPDPAKITTTCVNEKFVGSGKVTSNSAGALLVATANQFKGTLNGGAYDGFDPAAATSTVILPLIMNANGGFATSINLMNVGLNQTTVNCTFAGSTHTNQVILDPGKGKSLLQADPYTGFGGTKYVGSATCTASSSGKILAVVNELGASTYQDQLLVYEGISMP